MEFEAVVFSVLPLVKGESARGQWMKQEIIFELTGEFSKKLCVGFWGDRAQDAGALKPGDVVAVSANVESREYNGRWYTEVRAWRMSKITPKSAAVQGSELPPLAEYPISDIESGGEADDLPF